jgi:ubiquinone/menaquinone biosynthesis C-methylase UbiE
MLAETLRNVQTEGLSAPQAVRCDSARLPFASNSLDAVHAGAAMHCWPRLETAIQEVHRVLKPGGVFYASTFFTSAYGMPDRMPRAPQGSGFFFFLDEPEIKAFVEENGFSPVEPSAEGAGSGDVTMGGKVISLFFFLYFVSSIEIVVRHLCTRNYTKSDQTY